MKHTLSFESFCFRNISMCADRHNDNSFGISNHFIARMRMGSGVIRTLSGKEIRLSAGDFFYLPKGLRYHSYWTVDKERGRVEWESYGFSSIPDNSGRQFDVQKLTPTKSGEVYLDRIAEDMTVCPTSVGYLYLFLGDVMPTMKESDMDPKHLLMNRAMEYIKEHRNFKVSELARHCRVSESGIYALFKEYANSTPIEVKNRFMLEEAVSLLVSTDSSIEEIAESVGFCSGAYLRRVMKQLVGKTPKQIRKEGGII